MIDLFNIRRNRAARRLKAYGARKSTALSAAVMAENNLYSGVYALKPSSNSRKAQCVNTIVTTPETTDVTKRRQAAG